jgi:hypothetical protein
MTFAQSAQYQTATLAAPSGSTGNVGYAVDGSTSANGDVILSGAYLDDELAPSAGAAYFYRRSGSTWTQQKVKASDGQGNDVFGSAVAVSGTRNHPCWMMTST